MADALVQRKLFGGAILCALPERMQDVSDFRPVPDHQEVFADAAADQSLIVEVVEHSSVADGELAAWLFRDLADANEASDSHMDSTRALAEAEVPGVPGAGARVMAEGTMVMGKGRTGSSDPQPVRVMLAALRLPRHSSDILVTLNTPSQAAHGAADQQALFAAVLLSLVVVDYGLFG